MNILQKQTKNVFRMSRIFYFNSNTRLNAMTIVITVETRHNHGPREWQNLFGITRFRPYPRVLLLLRRRISLYQGFCYIEVRYIKVVLYSIAQTASSSGASFFAR